MTPAKTFFEKMSPVFVLYIENEYNTKIFQEQWYSKYKKFTKDIFRVLIIFLTINHLNHGFLLYKIHYFVNYSDYVSPEFVLGLFSFQTPLFGYVYHPDLIHTF